MMKKIIGFILALVIVSGITAYAAELPDFQSPEEAKAQCDAELDTDSGSTVYMKVCGKNYLYVTVLSMGQLHVVETDPGSFVPTIVTAVDADGNELGTVEAANGILDFTAYDGQIARLHLVTTGYDDYYIEITPDGVPKGFTGDIPDASGMPQGSQKSGFFALPWNSILTIGGWITLCIMVCILVISIYAGYKFGTFGKKKK